MRGCGHFVLLEVTDAAAGATAAEGGGTVVTVRRFGTVVIDIIGVSDSFVGDSPPLGASRKER